MLRYFAVPLNIDFSGNIGYAKQLVIFLLPNLILISTAKSYLYPPY